MVFILISLVALLASLTWPSVSGWKGSRGFTKMRSRIPLYAPQTQGMPSDMDPR